MPLVYILIEKYVSKLIYFSTSFWAELVKILTDDSPEMLDKDGPHSLIGNGLHTLDTPFLEYSHTNFLLVVTVKIHGRLCRQHPCISSRLVDACRKFYTEICTREALILDAIEERKVSREVGQTVYYEEMESYIKAISEDYEATVKMGKDSASILVVFPYMLLEQMNRVIERTKQF